MNATSSRLVRLLLVIVGFSAPLRAREPAPPASPVVFTAFAWDVFDTEKDLTVNYRQSGKKQAVEVTWRDRSAAGTCDGPGPLVFTQTIVRDGKSIEAPVASADIPAGVTRALLMFGRNPSRAPGALPYEVKVFDDSYSIFPGQSVRFLNYSRTELGGLLGEQTFSVVPGREQVVPAVRPPDGQLVSLRLAGRDATGGWRKLRSTMLPMSEGQRVLVFLTDSRRHSASPELVILRDRVEADSPAAAKTP